MKKLIFCFLIVFIIFSCSISYPSWTSIGTDGVYIETVNDTVDVDRIDSILKSHNIKPSLNELAVMRFYNSSNDYLEQYTYTKGQDTIYVITSIDSLYVFTKRVKQYENK